MEAAQSASSLSVLPQQGESSAGFGKQLHPWEHPDADFPGGTCSRGGETTESRNILGWKGLTGIIEPDSWPFTSQESSVNDREGNSQKKAEFTAPRCAQHLLSFPCSLEPGSLGTFAAEFQEFQQFPKPGLCWQLRGKESVPCSLALCLRLVIKAGNKRED